MNGNKKVFAILGAGAAVIGGVLLFRALGAGKETTDDAQIEADVVSIAARVGGQVAKVEVADNARVKAGDVIVRLDPADLTARLHQAKGELDAARAQAAAAEAQVSIAEAGARGGLSSAEAQVGTSKAQVSGALAQVDAARAQVMRAEADAERAAADLARVLQLRAANAVPDERVETARSADAAAKATLLAAKAQQAAAEEARKVAESRVAEASGNLRSSTPIDAKIAAAKANAELAQARVTSAQAAYELAELSLSYTEVRAPVDGTVSALRAREGQMVSPGQPIASVVPAATYVVANFKETQISHMREGQEVEVAVDAFGSQHLRGKIESLSSATGARFSLLPPDNASGNFVKVVQRVPVRIAWTDVPKEVVLRAGLSAEVTVHTR